MRERFVLKPLPLVMGIVNVTPDSFSDGGKFFDPEKAIQHGLQLIEEGADILDIGGESTRPNSEPVPVDEEISRVVPVIKGLAHTGTPISIDTRHAQTMQAAIEVGAGFINDISALRGPDNLEVAARSGLPVCLMHMKGEPKTMQENPAYGDVVAEVFEFLTERIEACLQAGISKDRIYADIGIGFGKTLEHNIALLQHLEKFHQLGVKLLLGTSRKRFIETIAGGAAGERLGGSLAAALRGLEAGAHILRVHDVAQTVQALKVWNEIRRPDPIAAPNQD